MSDEVIVEDAVGENPDPVIHESEKSDPVADKVKLQMKVGSAMRSYLKAKERRDRANEEFTNCCHALHECMKPNDRFVLRDSYGSYGPCYLVETNHEGKFKIEPIELM